MNWLWRFRKQDRNERGEFTSGEASSGSGSIKDKNGKEYVVRHSMTGSDRNKHAYMIYPSVEDADRGSRSIGLLEMKRDGVTASYRGVQAEYRRLSLATALHEHAEKHLGVKIKQNNALTEDGQAFWNSRKK